MKKDREISDVVELNLDEVPFYVTENYKSDLKVDAIIRGIEAGDEFKPIEVRKLEGEEVYTMANQGHHTVIGHYIAKKPLMCVVTGKIDGITPSNPFPTRFHIPIGEVKIIDDAEYDCLHGIGYEGSRKKFPNYR